MGISIKCMPIAVDRFTITVSLILLRYTVVRTAVCSRVPRYTAVRFLWAVPNPTSRVSFHFMTFVPGSVAGGGARGQNLVHLKQTGFLC